jgi:putative transposase
MQNERQMLVKELADSIRKDIFLSTKEIAKKWTMPVREWAMAYSQIMIFFADRFAS